MYRVPYRLKLLFLIIPLSFCITGIIYIHNSGLYFLKSVDPEYGYLLNGAALACLKADIQFITNPGIPVHFLSAIVIAVVHLFRPGMPLLDDVAVNPELYMRSILYVVNGINVIILFILGTMVFRYTKNPVASLFLQLMGFTNLLPVEATARLMPEALMLTISACWIVVILGQLYKYSAKYSIIYGFLISLSVTDKLTFLPFLILPFILLENWKERLRFVLYSLGFFIILGYPLILNHHFFTDWVVGLISHTGPYGQGAPGFAKVAEFLAHLKAHIHYTPFLVGGLILLFTVSLTYKFITKTPEKHILRINTALVMLIIVQYIIASKQFAYHYLIPSILLTPLVYFMAITTVSRMLSVKTSTFMNMTMAAIGLLFIARTGYQMKVQMHDMKQSSMSKIAEYKRISPLLKSKPLIVSPSYYGCSSIEYALTYGLHVSGKNGNFLYKTIRRNYPDVFMYFPWGDAFYEGNHEVKPADFMYVGKDYRLYMSDFNDKKLNVFKSNLESAFPGFETETTLIDSIGSEFVFNLRFIPVNQ